ncbi:Lipoprotein Rz1 precursor [compost metagenome]
MHKSKMTAFGLMLMLGTSGCAFKPPAAPPPAVECPQPEPPPAWVMEPAQNLILLLDQLISPSGLESSE